MKDYALNTLRQRDLIIRGLRQYRSDMAKNLRGIVDDETLVDDPSQEGVE